MNKNDLAEIAGTIVFLILMGCLMVLILAA